MNIYNFIYCYFHNFWQKRSNDGRIVGSAHVLFSIIMHIFLFAEILWLITDYYIIKLPDFGAYGRNKTIYFFYSIPFWIALIFFYNKDRTKRLLKDYYDKYEAIKNYKNLRFVIYFVAPVIIGIALALLRQRA